jgi:pantetheine-phosphate adenylyltransferase
MERVAIFPGSFDPFTIGHEAIVKRAIPLFDKIIIAIGYNSAKKGFFPLEKRETWIKEIFKDYPSVTVDRYEGLTADYCLKINAKYILRGLRTAADFEYERAIGQMNKMLNHDIETVFMLTKPEHSPISSTIVREVIRHGGDASQFVPKEIDFNS